MSFTVRVLTPEKIELETKCEEVILPAVNGNLAVLKGHARLVSILKTGVFRERTEKGWVPIVISGGFAEVNNDVLIVLATGAERVSNDLTNEDAKNAFDDARKNYNTVKSKSKEANDNQDVIAAKAQMELAEARFEAFKYII
jgi:F-type H+-transporting ATPase subunit epsilon